MFVALLAHAGSEGVPPVRFSDQFSDRWWSQVSERPELLDEVPLYPERTVDSPSGESSARLVRTDGTRIPYEESVAYIHIESAFGEPVHFVSTGFRSVQIAWISESVISLNKDLGHVVTTEEIFDLSTRQWLVQRTVHHRWP